MPELRVRLLGRACVELDGQNVRLSPKALSVLIRLIIADGRPITVDEIFRDVWARSGPVDRDGRISVQKRVLALRAALDSANPGEKSQLLRTEHGRITAYRLVLARERVDMLQFQDLVVAARRSTSADAVDLLLRALDLWQGQPLADVADCAFAARTVRHLRSLHEAAMRELMRAFSELGQQHDALVTAEALSADLPDDGELAASLVAMRSQLRARQDKQIFRHDFADPGIAVVLLPGDLFAQDDANLVIGFSDTFDTATDRDLVISGESVQGQLTARLYGGDRKQLDQALKAALRQVKPASAESRSAKRHGKLIRYPVGTVASLRQGRRGVFAVAYSRMGNNLVAQSSLAELRTSLDSLWDAIYLHGQLKPVAMPLIGSGLARVHEASYDHLLTMIISSFVFSSRKRYMCPELRIIVQQAALEKIKAHEVLRFIREGIPGRS